MTVPAVSIVIPVYNRETFIGECLTSALQQSFADIEVIVSDNCSTDRTLAIAKDFASSDARVSVYANSENLGPARNWLSGIRLARGRYLKLLFSDDLLSYDAIELLHGALGFSNYRVAMSPGLLGETPWFGTPSYAISTKAKEYSAAKIDLLYLFGSKAPPVSPCAFLFDRDLYVDVLAELVASCPTEYLESGAGIDVLSILTAVTRSGGLVYVPQTTVFFRLHHGSITVACHDCIAEYYRSAKLAYVTTRYGRKAAFHYRHLRAIAKRARGVSGSLRTVFSRRPV